MTSATLLALFAATFGMAILCAVIVIVHENRIE